LKWKSPAERTRQQPITACRALKFKQDGKPGLSKCKTGIKRITAEAKG
jgi:hypothetical protein